MIKVHQTYFMPGIKASINKNFIDKIFVMIWSYTVECKFLYKYIATHEINKN